MRYIILLSILITFLSFYACEKEAEVKLRDYPYVITNTPKVGNAGAIFSANLANIGNQEILKYGFLWSREPHPTLQNQNKLFDNKAKKGIYSLDVKGGLEKGQTYYVRAYILTDQYEVYGNERSFDSNGSLAPVINDFTPKYGSIGTEVIIDGDNFASSKTENIVRIGNTVAIIDTITENQLKITIPKITQPENAQILIETAGMQTTSDDFFNLCFPWVQKSDFPGTSLRHINSFELNGKIYVCGGLDINTFQIMTDVWEYDSTLDKWTRKADFPGVPRYNAITFSCNGKGYYGMGQIFSSSTDSNILTDIWEYDPDVDKWTQKTNFPGVPIIYSKAFVIGNKAYISPGKYWKDSWSHFVKHFWEYDPSNNSWQQKKDFPDIERYWGFALGTENKGYIGLGSNRNLLKDIYMYDPVTDNWEIVGYYPGKGNLDIASFYIDGKLYLGMGNSNSTGSYTDMWEFDLINYSWKEMNPCPSKLSPSISHTINNKGYVGYGWYNLSPNYDEYWEKMWEFDPSKN